VREAIQTWATAHLPPPLAILMCSMLPIIELRGGIPLGHYLLGSSHWLAIYVYAVIGNLIPVYPILTVLGPVERFLRRWAFFNRFFVWLFLRTERRSGLIKKFGSVGLILFVAIPAPMTGAWTGALAAYLLHLPLRYSIPCITVGVLIAGGVMTMASLGVIALWH
jgi:uncharacterized membrane protein